MGDCRSVWAGAQPDDGQPRAYGPIAAECFGKSANGNWAFPDHLCGCRRAAYRAGDGRYRGDAAAAGGPRFAYAADTGELLRGSGGEVGPQCRSACDAAIAEPAV